jgi:hypothetical protein
MDCLHCHVPNPDEKKFCGDCGAVLNTPEEVRIRQLAESILEEQFRRRDQKLLELESADAIFDKLKKRAAPTIFAITVALAIVGFVGYDQFKSLLGAMKVTEAGALASLRGQTELETQHIRQEAAGERASLQSSASKETTEFHKEVSTMRADSEKSSRELQAEVKQARTKLAEAQNEIVQLMTQGTVLKNKYDNVGTQLASLQNLSSQPGTNAVGLNESVSATDQITVLTQSPSSRIYSVGSSGPEVERIQSRLKELGCYDGVVDGQYGVSTKEAVERFNHARGDAFPSGVVDPFGWFTLFSLTGDEATSSLSGGIPRVSISSPSTPVLGAARCTPGG